MKHTSIYRGCLTNKTFATGQTIKLVNSRNDHSMVQEILIDLQWVISASGALNFVNRKVIQKSLLWNPREVSSLKSYSVTCWSWSPWYIIKDGTTSYTSRRPLGIFRDMFLGHLVSLQGNVGWHPRSLNLTLCDFFLWGQIKSQLYQYRPANLEKL